MTPASQYNTNASAVPAAEIEKRIQFLEDKAHDSCKRAKEPSVSEDLARKVEELWGWYNSVKSKV